MHPPSTRFPLLDPPLVQPTSTPTLPFPFPRFSVLLSHGHIGTRVLPPPPSHSVVCCHATIRLGSIRCSSNHILTFLHSASFHFIPRFTPLFTILFPFLSFPFLSLLSHLLRLRFTSCIRCTFDSFVLVSLRVHFSRGIRPSSFLLHDTKIMHI